MRNARLSLLLGVVATAALWTGLRLGAAPFLPAANEPPGELLSLAGLQRVNIRVWPLPTLLHEQNVTDEQVERAFRSRVANQGFEIAADPDAPQLVLRILVTTEPQRPDDVVLITIVAAHQMAHLGRLDRTLMVPTATLTKAVLTTVDQVEALVPAEVNAATDRLAAMVKRATRVLEAGAAASDPGRADGAPP